MSEKECQCRYHRARREAEAQGPRPGWLQREFDAARKATAPPAAGPWVKIEPGCEMPEVLTRVLAHSEGRGHFFAFMGGDEDRREAERRHWAGTHYAVLRMPEGK